MSSTPPMPSVGHASPGGLFSTRGQIIFAACACAGATAFVYAVDPNQHAVYPQCFFYNTTGIYCAGCGATRAVYALLHGRVLEALRDNALFVTALPVILFVAGAHLVAAWRENAWPKLVVEDWVLMRGGVAIFLLMMGFMVLRNLPGWPFEWLRPLAG